MDDSWKHICTPEPVYVSAIACGLEESETLTHSYTAVTVRHREMVVRSTLVQVFLNGVSVCGRFGGRGGSDINLLGPRLVADNPHWKTQKSNVSLNFGNASQGTATRAVMNNRVSAGNVAHMVYFFVSSQEIPGCDIILGTLFLTYSKARRCCSRMVPSFNGIFISPFGMFWFCRGLLVGTRSLNMRVRNCSTNLTTANCPLLRTVRRSSNVLQLADRQLIDLHFLTETFHELVRFPRSH